MLTDNDVQLIADRIFARMELDKKRFWIEPEMHYNDHKELRDLMQDYKMAKGIFWKSFIGLAVIGTLVTTLVGFGFNHIK